jgi:hypothetical protein
VPGYDYKQQSQYKRASQVCESPHPHNVQEVALDRPPFDPRPWTGSCIRPSGSAPDLYVFLDFDALEFIEA